MEFKCTYQNEKPYDWENLRNMWNRYYPQAKIN